MIIHAGVISAGEITGDFGEPSISDFNPKSGSPGTEVMLMGTHFVSESTAENMVMFGDAVAEIKTAAATELSVIVPEGAQTSPITVMTPGGWATSSEDFLVTTEATFKFEPPANENRDFTIQTPHGGSELAQDGTARVAVDKDNWTLTNAIPTAEESMAVYMRLHFPVENATTQSLHSKKLFSRCYQESVTAAAGEGTENINALSTAYALVFFSPFFINFNLEDADRMMSIIENDAAVAHLASVIEDVYPNTDEPFNDQGFVDALVEAVESVGQSIPDDYKLNSTAGLNKEKEGLFQTQGKPAVYEQDFRTMDIIRSGQSVKIDTISTNPMDWIIRVAELKRDTIYDIFPQGGKSLVHANPRASYEREPNGFSVREMRLGKAITRRFAIVTTLIGDLVDALDFTGAGGGTSITLPDKDAIYIVRAFAPIFDDSVDGVELGFIQNSPNNAPGKADLDRAIQMNLLMLVVDAADTVLGIYNTFDGSSRRELLRASLAACDRAMARELPNGYGAVTDNNGRTRRLLRVFKDTLDAFVKQCTIEAANVGLDKAMKMAMKKSGSALVKVAKTASVALLVTDIISYLGPIGERLAGMAGVGLIELYDLELSPMETAFVMVGDPFDWDVDEVIPDESTPGDVVTLKGKNFDVRGATNNEIWLLTHGEYMVKDPGKDWEGVRGGLKAKTLSVNQDGTELTFQIPSNQKYGYFYIWLRTRYGRLGRPDKAKPITIRKMPRLLSLTPNKGFAVVPAGTTGPFSNFQGTRVELTGYGFDWSQEVKFGATKASTVSVTDTKWVVRVPQMSAGNTQVHVESPQGDVSQHLPFTVLGKPITSGINPSEARVGQLVVISGQNFGNRLDEVEVEFSDYQYKYAKTLSVKDNEIVIKMPAAGHAGDTFQVTVWTPAGQSGAVNITRLKGITIPQHTSKGEGYTIPVEATEAGLNPGGAISLNEAVAIGNGNITPFKYPYDDRDEQWTHHLYEKKKQVGVDDEGKPIYEYYWEEESVDKVFLEDNGHAGHEHRKHYTVKHHHVDHGGNVDSPVLTSTEDLDTGGDDEHMPEEWDLVQGDVGGKDYEDFIEFPTGSATYFHANGLELDNFDKFKNSAWLDLGGGKLTLNNHNYVAAGTIRNTSGVDINGDSNELNVTQFEGRIPGNGVTITEGIDNEVNVTITDGCDGHSVYIDRGHKNEIYATIEGASGDGIYINDGQENYFRATIKQCAGNGVTINGGQNNPGEKSLPSILTVEDCAYGLKINNSHGNSVWNCFIRNNSKSGIYIRGDDNSIGFKTYSENNGGYGIELVDAKANRIDGGATYLTNNNGGVYIGDGSKYNLLRDVEIRGSANDGILIEGFVTVQD